MWKPEHRLAADRRGLRYPSDLTDAEWAIVAAMIPPGRHGGRRRSVNVREVLNGIFYVLWTGCQWKALPEESAAESKLPGWALRRAVLRGSTELRVEQHDCYLLYRSIATQRARSSMAPAVNACATMSPSKAPTGDGLPLLRQPYM